jgi:hypothetical protein
MIGMSTKRSQHTHRGHCQHCGRIQAVDNITQFLAKHGYIKEMGFFEGVCKGSGLRPLELERTQTDSFIIQWNEWAKTKDSTAQDYEDGKLVPLYCKTGEQMVDSRFKDILTEWDKAHPAHQQRHLSSLISELRTTAKSFRKHAESMGKLADQIHKQPLMVVEPAKKIVLEKGDLVRAYGHEVKIEKIIKYRGSMTRYEITYPNGNSVWLTSRSLELIKKKDALGDALNFLLHRGE